MPRMQGYYSVYFLLVGPSYAFADLTRVDTVYHESRTSTVQALVLMGVRAFGVGKHTVYYMCSADDQHSLASVEEGWLHVGRLNIPLRLYDLSHGTTLYRYTLLIALLSQEWRYAWYDVILCNAHVVLKAIVGL